MEDEERQGLMGGQKSFHILGLNLIGFDRSASHEWMASPIGGGLPAATRAKAAAKLRGYRDPFLDAVAAGLEGSAGQLVELLETCERYRLAWERVFEEFDVVLAPVCSTNAFPHDDRFIVYFKYEVTPKDGPMKGKRMQVQEAGLYTVKNGKITQEEFFYHM